MENILRVEEEELLLIIIITSLCTATQMMSIFSFTCTSLHLIYRKFRALHFSPICATTPSPLSHSIRKPSKISYSHNALHLHASACVCSIRGSKLLLISRLDADDTTKLSSSSYSHPPNPPPSSQSLQTTITATVNCTANNKTASVQSRTTRPITPPSTINWVDSVVIIQR